MDDLDTLRSLFANLDTSSCCDADKELRVLDPAIRPLQPAPRLLGFARIAVCRGDFLPVVRTLAGSRAGDVLVVDAGGGPRAVAGELFATEARRRGLGGMVIDGAVRDTATLRTLDLAVYARHISPMAGRTRSTTTARGTVWCGGVPVQEGDVLFGDADGVIVVSPEAVQALTARAAEIQRTEAAVLARLRAGTPLTELLNLDEHWSRRLRGEDSALGFTVS